MKLRTGASAGLIAALAVAGCQAPTGLSCGVSAAAARDGTVCVDGTVRYLTLEGGFWAVRDDDGTTYELLGGLPERLQREGLPVELYGIIRKDVGSYRMVGPIVEIIRVRER